MADIQVDDVKAGVSKGFTVGVKGFDREFSEEDFVDEFGVIVWWGFEGFFELIDENSADLMEIVLDSFDENVGMFGFEWCKEVSGVSVCEFSELDASKKMFKFIKDSE